MKVNKYSTDKRIDNLKSRLRSYGTMAAAFMVAGGAQAQCGTADAASPVLGVDIDGDGTVDVNINWNAGAVATATQTSTVPVAASTNLFSTQIGTIAASFYVAGNFTYFGCQPAYIPAYFGAGLGGGAFFQGDPAWGSYTNVTATAPVNYQVNAIGVFEYYFTAISNVANYASASGAGSNQIVGLSAAGASVCGAIDSAPGLAGPNNITLGSAGSTFYYYFNVLAANSAQYVIPAATASIVVPSATCFTFSYATFGLYLPPVPAVPATYASAVIGTLTGPLAIGTSATGTNNVAFQNANATTHLAVQFAANGETHNGWIEISIDPATSAITCVATGYQECSIETAVGATGSPLGACITTGEATSFSAACIPPVLNPDLSDPCACGNPNNIMTDAGADPTDVMASVAYFAEAVTVDVPVGGTIVGVTDGGNTGILDGAGMPANAVFTNNGDTNGDGFDEWTADFFHVPDVGYTLTVDVDIDGVVTPLPITNSCAQCIEAPAPENVPTVGEWGLIMLGLLMSITAIVGIRARREEEVTA